MQITKKFGNLLPKIDIEALYSLEQREEFMWIYKNKILDEIQLIPLELDFFDDSIQ